MASPQPPAAVVVVDDDARTAELVRIYLERDGHVVCTCHDGRHVQALAREIDADLIVLDLMLPGIDGIELCRRIRMESDVLILMLTARVMEGDRLTGFEVGADDYLIKPFSPRELAARARALLRRGRDRSSQEMDDAVNVDTLTVDFRRHTVSLDGFDVALTAVEFRLLGVMVRDPERVYTRGMLVELLFGHDYEGVERSIDVHIFKLRRKLAARGHLGLIATVYGVGYKLLDHLQ